MCRTILSCSGAALFILVTSAVPTVAQDEEKAQRAGGQHAEYKLTDLDDLVGSEIHDQAGQSIGEINDVVVEPDEGHIRYVAVSPAEFADREGQLVAVPWKAFMMKKQQDQEQEDAENAPRQEGQERDEQAENENDGKDRKMILVLKVDERALREASGFKEDDTWPGLPDSEHWAQFTGPDAGEVVQAAGEKSSDQAENQSQPGLRLTKVSGLKVMTHEGKELGKIDKLIVDRSQGKLAYVTVSVGGFLGVGDDHLAVPPEALNYKSATGADDTDPHFEMEITEDDLKEVPQVTDEADDPNVHQEVVRHFKLQERKN